jgi:fermentation-respiration switch protein FrsA (DUF1100 family)
LVLAGCYLGVIVVLLFLENYLIFHPTVAAAGWLAPPNLRVQDIELRTADGTQIHAWWCPREGAQGALLYCHGNAGNLSHRGEGIRRWQEGLKESVLIFDYPGYGKSAGKPHEQGCYAAGDAAYDWLTQQAGIPADRVVIYGGSLGGGVAVDLASRRPHRALVLVSTFTSIPDMAQQFYPWLPARWLVRTRFDNLQKIRQCHRPVFIAHGDEDGLVPYSHGQCLSDAANEPKRFFPMPGHDHGDALAADFFPQLRQFLQEAETRRTGEKVAP